MNPILPNGKFVMIRTTLLNNLARIIYKDTAITADQHRDLENLLSLIISDARNSLESEKLK